MSLCRQSTCCKTKARKHGKELEGHDQDAKAEVRIYRKIPVSFTRIVQNPNSRFGLRLLRSFGAMHVLSTPVGKLWMFLNYSTCAPVQDAKYDR
jgi:hypothetical protein